MVAMGTPRRVPPPVAGVKGGFLKEDTPKPNPWRKSGPDRGNSKPQGLKKLGDERGTGAGKLIWRARGPWALFRSLYFILGGRVLGG